MAEMEGCYRVLVLGESKVGKTSLVQRYVFDVYDETGPHTGKDEEKKTVYFKNGRQVELKICDTAGQERVDLLTGQFYQNTDAIIFVYDITNSRTLWHADTWIQDWKIHIEQLSSIPVLFVGNKCDVPRPSPYDMAEEEGNPDPDSVRDNGEMEEGQDFVNIKQVKTLVRTNNFLRMPIECSARTGENVRRVFETIAAEVAMVKPPSPNRCVCL